MRGSSAPLPSSRRQTPLRRSHRLWHVRSGRRGGRGPSPAPTCTARPAHLRCTAGAVRTPGRCAVRCTLALALRASAVPVGRLAPAGRGFAARTGCRCAVRGTLALALRASAVPVGVAPAGRIGPTHDLPTPHPRCAVGAGVRTGQLCPSGRLRGPERAVQVSRLVPGAAGERIGPPGSHRTGHCVSARSPGRGWFLRKAGELCSPAFLRKSNPSPPKSPAAARALKAERG